MWKETASAPARTASSTVPVTRLSFSSGPIVVEPLRWTMYPASFLLGWTRSAMPRWVNTASAPPAVTPSMVDSMSTSPSTAPIVIPWSIGTMRNRSFVEMRWSRAVSPAVIVR